MNMFNKNQPLDKPFDIGNGIVSSSISNNGRIISINAAHKTHGYIKLTPVEPFSNNNWYKPEKVRAYRNSFLTEEIERKGYTLLFEVEKENRPVSKSQLNFIENTNTLFIKEIYDKFIFKKFVFIPPTKNFLIYLYEIENLSSEAISLPFVIYGSYGITRASYGQITENGPIPIPQINNNIEKVNSNQLKITETGTQSSSILQLIGEYSEFEFQFDRLSSSTPSNLKNSGKINLKPNEQKRLALIISLSDSEKTSISTFTLDDIYSLKKETDVYWEKILIKAREPEINYIINRNLAYTFGCCCIKNNGAMITDHQSLPLTWNRDNYYMYKLLEYAYRINKNPDILKAMKNHIIWLFTFITESGWGRSHLINGKIKDKVFQFDQQCYPIIQFYDYLNNINEDQELIELCTPKLDQLSNLLFTKKSNSLMLFETEENPADDPVLYPYHFSTQVLAWKTFKVLYELNKKYCFSKKDYEKIAHEIRENVFEFMIGEREGKRVFCYTTDTKGNYEYYHDANDLPTALAPLWDFLDVESNVFQKTMNWAFSKENRGYYQGPFGGLGSDHAKGHWPLGTSQLLAIALSYKGKSKVASNLWNRSLKRLADIVIQDGLFSESVDPLTGNVFTRYWFAWPGATISWLYLAKIIDN